MKLLCISVLLGISTFCSAAHGDAPARLFILCHDETCRTAALEWAAYRSSPEGGSWTVVPYEVAGLNTPAPSPLGRQADDAADASPERRTYTERRTPDQAAWEKSTRDAVREFIRSTVESHVASGGVPDSCAVLLLGDAPRLEAKTSNGNGTGESTTASLFTGIPTFRFEQPEKSLWLNSGSEVVDHFASDEPYRVIDRAAGARTSGSGASVALGRVPARTNTEARIALEKTKRYEAGPLLSNDGHDAANASVTEPVLPRITYVAGEGHFGPMDSLLERMFSAMVDRMVPEGVDVHMTYAKAMSPYCPPPSRLTQTVLDRMGEESVLFNYVGHGSAWGFDSLYWGDQRLRILQARDLGRLPGDAWSRTPLALLTCCSTGWFDLPNDQESLAEAMLFTPAAPVSVVAGSRPTHPYANTVMQRNMTRAVLDPAVSTVGEAFVKAGQWMTGERDQMDEEIDALAAPVALAMKWDCTLPELRRMHTRLYNLLGDPALVLRPAWREFAPVAELRVEGNSVAGVVPGMVKGEISITLETPRESWAYPERFEAVTGDSDPELERKAGNNYELVNDRVVHRLRAKVDADGRFAVECPAWMNGAGDPAAARVAVIRVAAAGSNAAGKPMRAAGGIRLGASSTTPSIVR